ncbi:Adenosine kinase [Dorcoceras hygrometricum]|uniref:Adenosine kinase n=1 Tax=Dorcoceras hygrometricum TaxID=472368 RepID=A0A2Z7BC09_9LAMI|nr:Adenosine kinase [Dorcoceras hygrometricum]
MHINRSRSRQLIAHSSGPVHAPVSSRRIVHVCCSLLNDTSTLSTAHGLNIVPTHQHALQSVEPARVTHQLTSKLNSQPARIRAGLTVPETVSSTSSALGSACISEREFFVWKIHFIQKNFLSG